MEHETSTAIGLTRIIAWWCAAAASCAAAFAALIALNISTMPHAYSELLPVQRVAPAPPVPPESQKTVELDPRSVPRLPLTPGAVQNFIAPEGFDTEARRFLYAVYPEVPDDVVDFLASALPAAGWSVASTEATTPVGALMSVVDPSGAAGVLSVRSSPEGIPGIRTEVTGDVAVTRPSTRSGPPPSSAKQ